MTDPPKRFDERLLHDFKTALQTVLKTYPDLAAAVIVVAYKIHDHGSLPAFAVEWNGASVLAEDVLKVCAAIDQTGLALRREHDQAVAKFSRGLSLKKEQTADGKENE